MTLCVTAAVMPAPVAMCADTEGRLVSVPHRELRVCTQPLRFGMETSRPLSQFTGSIPPDWTQGCGPRPPAERCLETEQPGQKVTGSGAQAETEGHGDISLLGQAGLLLLPGLGVSGQQGHHGGKLDMPSLLGWMGSPQTHIHLKPQNMTLSETRHDQSRSYSM